VSISLHLFASGTALEADISPRGYELVAYGITDNFNYPKSNGICSPNPTALAPGSRRIPAGASLPTKGTEMQQLQNTDADEVLTRYETIEPQPVWLGTSRFGVRPAPDGLALVQDLLNTEGSADHLDLLRDRAHAQQWTFHAARAWLAERGVKPQQPPTLTDRDVAELGKMRRALSGAVDGVPGRTGDRVLGTAQLVLSEGALYWTPVGDGWRWFSAAIGGEVLASRQRGTWARLKHCANGACRAAFYDRSWNNASVWHNRITCGPPLASPYS
jgi:predicted RNA-binding Zn ribbon-like protein